MATLGSLFLWNDDSMVVIFIFCALIFFSSYEQMPTLFTAFDYHFSSHLLNSREGAKYPDTMAIAVDDSHKKVSSLYNVRSERIISFVRNSEKIFY